jgi:hypothetical protein
MKYVKLFLILFITLIVITNIQAQTKKSSSKQVQMKRAGTASAERRRIHTHFFGHRKSSQGSDGFVDGA